MSALSPQSPYTKRYYPSRRIVREDGKPVADVDTVHRLAPGYNVVVYDQAVSDLGAAMPESLTYPKWVLVDEKGVMVAIVEGVGKIFPGYQKRAVTPAEAALSGDNSGIF